MSDKLERRLATALSDDGITSSMLAALIDEADIAIADADATAEREREKAMDPELSPDPRKARAAMEDAQFMANRLRTLQPRLRKRLQHVSYLEVYERWFKSYEVVLAKRDAAVEELKSVYPKIVTELVDLLARVRAIDSEIGRVNDRKPIAQGEPWDGLPLLLPTECEARGVSGFNSTAYSLDRGVVLPDFTQPGKNSWPPHEPPFV